MRVRAAGARLPQRPPLEGGRVGGPAQGAVHRRLSDADVVVRRWSLAHDEPASEQDVCPRAGRDRGLPRRRDAPAGLAQPDGSAITARLRRRLRPRGVDWRHQLPDWLPLRG